MLSQTSEHVLRALAFLATLPPEQGATAGGIAEHAGVPRRYLSKLLRVLTRAQFLVGKPGAKGGYRLKASAARIRLVDAIVAFDPQVTQPICVLRGTRLCGRSSPCPVHDRWKLVRGSLNRFLETTTAADLARHGWRGWSAR